MGLLHTCQPEESLRESVVSCCVGSWEDVWETLKDFSFPSTQWHHFQFPACTAWGFVFMDVSIWDCSVGTEEAPTPPQPLAEADPRALGLPRGLQDVHIWSSDLPSPSRPKGIRFAGGHWETVPCACTRLSFPPLTAQCLENLPKQPPTKPSLGQFQQQQWWLQDWFNEGGPIRYHW